MLSVSSVFCSAASCYRRIIHFHVLHRLHRSTRNAQITVIVSLSRRAYALVGGNIMIFAYTHNIKMENKHQIWMILVLVNILIHLL